MTTISVRPAHPVRFPPRARFAIRDRFAIREPVYLVDADQATPHARSAPHARSVIATSPRPTFRVRSGVGTARGFADWDRWSPTHAPTAWRLAPTPRSAAHLACPRSAIGHHSDCVRHAG